MVRGRARRRAAGARVAASRRAGPRLAEEDETEAYLRQAIAMSARISAEGRPVKKRRVAGKLVLVPSNDESDAEPDPKSAAEQTAATTDAPLDAPAQQTAYTDNDDDDDDSDDSDFEDVDLAANAAGAGAVDANSRQSSEAPQELNIVLGNRDGDQGAAGSRRKGKGVTAKERQLRVEIHKMHVLCLISHVSIRNHWCNDDSIQATMRKILPKKTIDYLVDDESQSQFQRALVFKEGLEQALESFQQNFKISARGMARSFWAENADEISRLDMPDDIDLPLQKPDFRKCAKTRSASRDVGAQLFCAMLRGIGMDVRLVCSLQPLPITSAAKGTAPEIRKITSTVPHRDTRIGFSPGPDRVSDSSANETASPKPRAPITSRFAPSRSRTGTPSRKTAAASSRASVEKKKWRMPESRFPVYWVEVLDPAYQRWTPVDPLVTKTIGKAAKLEPPASDQQNAMSYVIAFEEDGSARDVTQRYTKAYNAKTRKLRIEATKNGERWWKRVVRLYRKAIQEPRDQIEDAQLAKKEAAEEMPKNIQEFKDHPYYALKRHIRKNEVIHPERQIGKVFTGKILGNETKESEPVYRRKDVLTIRSADSWYRMGREVKPEEIPLKWAQPRTTKSKIPEEPDPEAEESAGTALFAAYQTVIYRPPPVVRGRIPRNRFGNLDIYAPSMIPHGGAHIAHPAARDAARVLGIDYADAVVGFEFRGRQGTAVVRGAVIASPHVNTIVDVINGFAYDKAADDAERRSENALKMWRHILSALRIRERIQGYAVEGEQDEDDEGDSTFASEDEGSGGEDLHEEDPGESDFLPDYETFLKAQPPIEIVYSTAPDTPPTGSRRQSGTLVATSNNGNNQTTRNTTREEVGKAMSEEMNIDKSPIDHDPGGGILLEDEDDPGASGGGFLTEEAETSVEFAANPTIEKDGPVDSINGLGQNTTVGKDANISLTENRAAADMETSGGGFAAADDESFSELAPNPATDNDIPMESTESVDDGDTDMVGTSPMSSHPLGAVDAAEEESDKGSLLSHDPDDDDADPEWLM